MDGRYPEGKTKKKNNVRNSRNLGMADGRWPMGGGDPNLRTHQRVHWYASVGHLCDRFRFNVCYV